MKAIICGHTDLAEGHDEIHRFSFELHDGSQEPPIRESVSLRTARVIVAHLEDGNALIEMFRAIVGSSPEDYHALIGQSFQDSFVEDGPSDRIENARSVRPNAASA